MPTYDYECTRGHHFELEQRITEEPIKRCRQCNAKATRLISATSFILKGGGWYSDGYSGKKGGSAKASGSDSDSSSSSSSSTESKPSTTDSKPSSGDSKPSSSSASAD